MDEKFLRDYNAIQVEQTDAPTREVLEMLKDQVLLCLVKRLGGKVKLTVEEVNNTGGYHLYLDVAPGGFEFRLERIQ